MTTKRPALRELDFLNGLKAVRLSFRMLLPFHQIGNPVMFVVYAGALLTGFEALRLSATGERDASFAWTVSVCLWLTVLFANFAQAYAQGRGQAQADTLKRARRTIEAKRLKNRNNKESFAIVPAQELRQDDFFVVHTGDFVPVDGQVVEGIASIDESAITGESAPVIRESGSDRDAVTGGTRVLSDWLVVRATADPGESHLDRMIAMVEGARRQKTPNEIALSVLLAAVTVVFLLSCASLYPFMAFSSSRAGNGSVPDVVALVALFVCLAPTTIGGLLSAIGIAGMNRLMRANIIATSGRAVEAAGDVDVLLLDKTGTITFGNRQAVAFFPAMGVNPAEFAQTALLASLADETPEGKSIVALAGRRFGLRAEALPDGAQAVPFSAETRLSGLLLGNRAVLKGAGDAIKACVAEGGGIFPTEVVAQIEKIARRGGTPLVVADGSRVLGVVHLKDVIKSGMKARLAALRAMGIKSVMVTGDNPLTAAAIASEAGVDDFIAEATPEAKLRYIRRMQDAGALVAMVGDGTNDAPALAQSDVALAMNTGTQAAKEASNMVDLDSDPTKLIEVVGIGKELLMTRGALTAFSMANDVAKYFAVMPAVFSSAFPFAASFDVLRFSTPENAILAALLYNALSIAFLIPLAMRGVSYRPASAEALLRRNLFVYGGGGLVLPFAGIKAIDVFLSFIGRSG